ncbi:TatD family hydrolase [Patescibacteria group bacterium]|nr:TatD family hydrolase [Patescibacteria group bacterium]
MSPKYIDIHAHLNDKQFDADRDEVLKQTNNNYVWVINIGTDSKTSQYVCEMSVKNKNCFATVGIHPTDNTEEKFDLEFYYKIATTYPKIVAIGECGLDYFRINAGDSGEKHRQKELFESHIDFAAQLKKPLMIHCREAYSDLLDILTVKKREYGDLLQGNIHCFLGDVEMAKKYLNLDFSISFTGIISWARDYDDVIRYISIDKMMAETDAPYLAPIPHRGKRCEPIFISDIVKKIALIRNENENTITKKLVQNARNFFDI